MLGQDSHITGRLPRAFWRIRQTPVFTSCWMTSTGSAAVSNLVQWGAQGDQTAPHQQLPQGQIRSMVKEWPRHLAFH
jgi:hypothetical protein